MKKKSRISAPSSPRQELRARTAYEGGRAFFGLPFRMIGTLLILGAVAIGIWGDQPGGHWSEKLLPGSLMLVAGLFHFAVAALANAVFDMADTALASHQRAKAADALEAYKESRRAIP